MDSDKNTLLVLKDPVCGMAVTAQSTHHLKHDNKAFYFCSASCKAKFNDNPSQYLDTQSVIKPSNTTIKTSAIATTGIIYTCPMHPEVRQDHPGHCPKCGMT